MKAAQIQQQPAKKTKRRCKRHTFIKAEAKPSLLSSVFLGFLHKLSSTKTKDRSALHKMMISLAASNRMPSFLWEQNAGLDKPPSAPQPQRSGGPRWVGPDLDLGSLCAPAASLPHPRSAQTLAGPGLQAGGTSPRRGKHHLCGGLSVSLTPLSKPEVPPCAQESSW